MTTKTERHQLFDVIAVNYVNKSVRMMGQDKTEENAEAVQNMAIMRRGLDTCFYKVVPAGKYKDGDQYRD